MSFWVMKEDRKLFLGGLYEYEKAAVLAVECGRFKPDAEEEQTAEEEVSCYNCRYRRWIQDGFECLKP